MSRGGFTLLEVLLAAALSVLLCTAACAILGQIAAEIHRGAAEGAGESPLEGAARVLRSDLEAALRMRSERDGLVLFSLRRLGDLEAEATHGPTLIEYRLAEIPGGRALLRSEQECESRSSRNVHTELVSGCVAHFEVRLPEREDEAHEALAAARGDGAQRARAPLAAPDVLALPPVPSLVEILLWPEGSAGGPVSFPVVR